jgi:hypothetical protein
MGTEEESLTKVYIDLPQHWATGGESMWALPLGDNLFEIRNTPFHAYGINWGDIVRADSNDPQLNSFGLNADRAPQLKAGVSRQSEG